MTPSFEGEKKVRPSTGDRRMERGHLDGFADNWTAAQKPGMFSLA